MVDLFPPHTQGIKNGDKNIIKNPPKKRAEALFFYSTNYSKTNKNNTWEVANNYKYDIMQINNEIKIRGKKWY